MKKLLLILALCPLICGAQNLTFTGEKMSSDELSNFKPGAHDTICLTHSRYTSWFIKSQHIPYVVKYTLTGDMLNCSTHIARTNKFTADPLDEADTKLNRDYKGSRYDQGHNMSAEDNACDNQAMQECFYFSNLYPQTPKLNRGVWKALENEERALAASDGLIRVYIGSVAGSKTIGQDKVGVPAKCWKVIYRPKTGEYEAWIFPNSDNVTGSPDDFKTDVQTITGLCGVKFE